MAVCDGGSVVGSSGCIVTLGSCGDSCCGCFWLVKMSLSCSSVSRVVVPSGGRMLFLIVDRSVCLRSLRVAVSSSFLSVIGIFRLPCGYHLTVSAMRTFPVLGMKILKQR